MIEQIPMQDRHTKGDLYEYLLSKLSQSGVNGQFRTPRHIIKMMVEMIKPLLSEEDAGKSDVLTENDVMEPEALFQAPFTDRHDEGVYGYYAEAEVIHLSDRIQAISANVIPDYEKETVAQFK